MPAKPTRDLLGAGLLGWLVGRQGHLHLGRRLAFLALVALAVLVLLGALVVTYWHLVVLGLVVVALVLVVRRHNRRMQPRWPTSGPSWQPKWQVAAKPGQDALDRAFAAGYTRGQREARKVEASWRSVPAGDPTDEDSF